MEEKKFDSLIQETLEQEAGRVSMSPKLQRQIKQEIRQGGKKEGFYMKHFSKKKIIVAVAVMCAMMSIVAVAAGRVAVWSSGNNAYPDFTSFADMGKLDQHMGTKVKSVEKFTNGMAFSGGYLKEVNLEDENGTAMGKFPEAYMVYKNGSRKVSVNAIPLGKDDGASGHAQIKEIPYGDTVIKYTLDKYKSVPVTYEIKPEAQAAIDAGELYITYGSEKDDSYRTVTWDGNLCYSISAFDDSGLGEEELIQMAKEMIDAQQ